MDAAQDEVRWVLLRGACVAPRRPSAGVVAHADGAAGAAGRVVYQLQLLSCYCSMSVHVHERIVTAATPGVVYQCMYAYNRPSKCPAPALIQEMGSTAPAV
jgi:hypothetical protein